MGWVLAGLAAIALIGSGVLALARGGGNDAGDRAAVPVGEQHRGTSRAGSPSGGPSSTVPSPATTSGAAASWLKANVSRESMVLAPDSLASTLRSAGFTHAVGLSQDGDVEAAQVQVLVDDTNAATTSVVTAVRARSFPVARFGGSSSALTVMQAGDGDHATDLAARSADVTTRRTAGADLLANQHIHPDARARSQLSSGTLDLRASTVIALAAQNGDVEVRGSTPDAAEQAVGAPVRSVELFGQSADAWSRLLSSLPATYRPSQTTSLAGAGIHLVWPVSAVPVTPVR